MTFEEHKTLSFRLTCLGRVGFTSSTLLVFILVFISCLCWRTALSLGPIQVVSLVGFRTVGISLTASSGGGSTASPAVTETQRQIHNMDKKKAADEHMTCNCVRRVTPSFREWTGLFGSESRAALSFELSRTFVRVIKFQVRSAKKVFVEKGRGDTDPNGLLSSRKIKRKMFSLHEKRFPSKRPNYFFLGGLFLIYVFIRSREMGERRGFRRGEPSLKVSNIPSRRVR